jgi:microcystin-dependent protein
LESKNVPAPAVTVTLPVVSDSTPTGTPTGNNVKLAAQGVTSGDTVSYYSANASSPVVANLTANVTLAGGSTPTPVDISQPYVVMRYIICVNGLYPVRDQ